MSGKLLAASCSIACLLLTAFQSRAAVLATYAFGVSGNETTAETGVGFAATNVALHLTATDISDPAGAVGIEISSAATTPANAPFLRLDPQAAVASAAAAVAANKYFQFAVSSDASSLINLTSLTFNAERGGAGTPRGYAVRSSADGFAANLASADLLTARPTYTPVSVDLSAAAFQNLSTITFRIYSYAPAAGSSVDYDDITVNGSVVSVPEPSAALLPALASLGLLSRRRLGR